MDVNFNKAASAYNQTSKIGGGTTPQLPSLDDSSGVEPDFAELVGNSLLKAIQTEYKSESTTTKALAGKADLHELVTAVNNAELTLSTVISIRDKVINAYHDIVKMPI